MEEAGQCREGDVVASGQGSAERREGERPGLEPGEQEVREQRWPVGCFGSAFRSTAAV